MICSKCHSENPDNSTFCRECGNKLTESVNLRKDNFDQAPQNPYVGNAPVGGNPFENGNNYQNAPQANPYPSQSYPQYQAQTIPQNIPYYTNMDMPQDEHVSVGEWIGLWCLNLIPVVGSIIFLVLLFVWAFGDTPKKSLKTYSRAQLLMLLIVLVLTIILYSIASTLS